ncbi:MAG TPA: flagellar biosynthesis anti-sigma factor FlgM [Chloroflexota bacterium]|jgi:flagellar biosynthesis anti-sigma factor FlgM|nr:flagellar biosynthesis anti-sigma factor FlgM [Chloroflexota bacterium]
MKIDETALRNILQAYGPKGKAVPSGPRTDGAGSTDGRGDEISISSQGQELQRMIRAAQQAEEVRAARVEELRTQLRTGKYLLDPQLIAKKMLGLNGGSNS